MGYIFLYALQVAMPIVIVELIAEFAVGIMMRLVPNVMLATRCQNHHRLDRDSDHHSDFGWF